MTEEQVERVAKAIEDADDRYHLDFGLHDYSSYGRAVPHVMRDYRIREGSQTIFESTNADEAQAFYTRHRRHTIARAAIEAMDGWQDIASAPRDGTRVLLWMEPMNDARFQPTDGPHQVIGTWVVWSEAMKREGMKEGWSWYGSPLHYATRWRPLPNPPGAHAALRQQEDGGK